KPRGRGTTMTIRTFATGDPGVPEEGLLIGRGGGYTEVYQDLVLRPDDTIYALRYVTEGGAIPEDHDALFLVAGIPASPLVPDLMRRLDDLGFESIESPQSTSDFVEYVVMTRADGSIHFVEWASSNENEVPKALLDLVR